MSAYICVVMLTKLGCVLAYLMIGVINCKVPLNSLRWNTLNIIIIHNTHPWDIPYYPLYMLLTECPDGCDSCDERGCIDDTNESENTDICFPSAARGYFSLSVTKCLGMHIIIKCTLSFNVLHVLLRFTNFLRNPF